MIYEVWHIESDELVGTVDIPNLIDHAWGAKVVVKVDGEIPHKNGMRFNAVEMRVCRMSHGTSKGERYWALETNLPIPFLKRLQGFTPRILIANGKEIHTFGKPANDETP
jgi:hypothetical protein